MPMEPPVTPPPKPSAPAPVMFRGIRYGRPGEKKFSLRLLLFMFLMGAMLTWLIDFFMPEPPPKPPAPVERVDEVPVRFGMPPRDDPGPTQTAPQD